MADTPLGLLRELADDVNDFGACVVCGPSELGPCIHVRARTLLAEMPPERAETALGGAKGSAQVERAREALGRAWVRLEWPHPVAVLVNEAMLAVDGGCDPTEAIDRAIAAAKQAGLWCGWSSERRETVLTPLAEALTEAKNALAVGGDTP